MNMYLGINDSFLATCGAGSLSGLVVNTYGHDFAERYDTLVLFVDTGITDVAKLISVLRSIVSLSNSVKVKIR